VRVYCCLDFRGVVTLTWAHGSEVRHSISRGDLSYDEPGRPAGGHLRGGRGPAAVSGGAHRGVVKDGLRICGASSSGSNGAGVWAGRSVGRSCWSR
jgi:hypothetical protein